MHNKFIFDMIFFLIIDIYTHTHFVAVVLTEKKSSASSKIYFV